MTRCLAGLLSVNGLWFAGLHICWALGWRWGIPASMPSVAERPWFLVYDLVAAALVVLLAVVAAEVVRDPGLAADRRRRGFFIATAAICGVRGAVGVVGDVAAVRDGSLTVVSALADGWFLTTAILAAGVVVAGKADRRRRGLRPGNTRSGTVLSRSAA